MQQGWVRLEDQLGNAEADTAADLGRRHRSEALIDARRRLLEVRSHWYPIMLLVRSFMVAVAWVTVNHDGKGSSALILWFGIREDLGRCVRLTSGLMSILLHCLGLVGS